MSENHIPTRKQSRKHHKPASTEVSLKDLDRAFGRSIKRLNREGLVASSTSAGTIQSGRKGSREGVQVFVKVERYSEALLERDPDSGGLLSCRKKTQAEIHERAELLWRVFAENSGVDVSNVEFFKLHEAAQAGWIGLATELG